MIFRYYQIIYNARPTSPVLESRYVVHGKQIIIVSIYSIKERPEVLTTDKDKAELFAQPLISHSILDDAGHPFPDVFLQTDKLLHSCHITFAKAAAIVAQLHPCEATGPDSIPVIDLQKCSPELSSVLSRLFGKCISESCFPSLWKFPTVPRVFKNCGDRSNHRNYRPISLLPVNNKVFEINDFLVKYLDTNRLFSDSQYGFRAEQCTVITKRVYRTLNVTVQARAGSLDISKEFDRIWHPELLWKLQFFGVSGSMLNIISSFL
ncbi:Hypothetical predicted protein [Octopus vulgaris]|uniref:Reverse transcriptase domain-containing protein n=1 Tax=Octopus vulgaris TaxID=6645 RepID=A0AA36B0Y6_OCTVU|nr:Hypothetical predicted protein [Octopus vulgaris]